MANQYTLTADFAAVEETAGTLYNAGINDIELASSGTTAKGAGILLQSGERKPFSGTVYARSMDNDAATLNVTDFTEPGGGGGGGSYTLPIATASKLGGVKVGNNLTINATTGVLDVPSHRLWADFKKDTVYEVGDVFRTPDTPSWGYWMVTTAGTSGDETTAPSGTVEGATATSGTMVCTLKSLTASGNWYLLRRNSKAYAAGDIAYSELLSSKLRLACVEGGATGAAEPAYTATPGAYVTDGTAKWIVEDWTDGTPVGRVVFDSVLRPGYVRANGATISGSSVNYPRLLAFLQENPSLLAADAAAYATNVGLYLYDSGTDELTLPNYIGRVMQGGAGVQSVEAGLPNVYGGLTTATWWGDTPSDTTARDRDGVVNISFNPNSTLSNKINSQQGTGGGFYLGWESFAASRGNSIYGNSSTVQPPAITLIPQIRY